MKTYRVAQVHREVDSWTVIRSIAGEEDQPLGHYPDRASAQSAWERLVAEEADSQSSDTKYEIIERAAPIRSGSLAWGDSCKKLTASQLEPTQPLGLLRISASPEWMRALRL